MKSLSSYEEIGSVGFGAIGSLSGLERLVPDYFEQNLARRKTRAALFADWQAFLADLTVTLPQVLPRLQQLRVLRRDGDTFIIEWNEMHVDYLKHRVPALYEALSKRCRMVKHAEK